jgi:PKD repeat protein
MNFSGGTVVGGSSPVYSTGINQATIISDSNGDVVCSTDGNKVYNSENAEIHEFSITTNENLLLPDPASEDRFYLFRSGSNGLNYSIIDMTLNGGAGGINADEEDIELGDYNVQMVAARHTNATDFWLITSHNQNGNSDDVTAIVYSINSSGVTVGDSEGQYFIYGGWYSTIDDMRISPECSKIVMAYKGHYLVLIQFDNQTGLLSNLITSSLDAVNSFGTADLDQWEFSADGTFLYDLEDHSGIARYSLENWDITSIGNSVETVVALDWNSVDIWTDLKLAIDGNIYLYNIDDNQIDKIINTSGLITDVEVVSGVLTFEDGLTNFFPNTSNFSCISLDAGVFHLYECLGDSTELWYSATIDADSVYWDFGDPDSGSSNISTEQAPIHIFSAPGEYEVILTVYFEEQQTTYDHTLTIYEIPDFDLGPDFIFCSGENSTIGVDATQGYTYYWNTGATSPTIEIEDTGNYELEVTNGGCSTMDEVYIEVFYPVTSTLDDQIVECSSGPVTLSSGSANEEVIEWNTGASTETITVENPGTYSVTLTNTCFESTFTTEVIFIEIPELITESELSGCYGDTLAITSNYTEGSILWNTGSTDTGIEVTESGEYSIAVDYLGCTRSDIIDVQLQDFIPVSWIEIPNVFSPNGDNKNQQFRPFVLTDPDYPLCNSPFIEIEMNVYNRWGNLLAENICAWDANANGADYYNEGVYYYIIDIRSVCLDRNQSIQKEGYVHIVSDKK